MTYAQITQEVYPAFQQLIQAQNAGMVILPQKMAYAFGKTLANLAKHGKAYTKLRAALIEQYCQKDDKGEYKLIKTPTGQEYEFREGERAVFIQQNKDLNETEVDCKLYPINRQELETVNNFPIQIFPILEEYEMITELSLQPVKTLKLMN